MLIIKKVFIKLAFVVFVILSGLQVGRASNIKTELSDSVEKKVPEIVSFEQALIQFKSLPQKEQRSKLKELKKTLYFYRKEKQSGKDVDTDLIIQVLLGIFIPPLGVYLHEGETNNKFWISVLLTLLGFLIFGFAGILFLGTLPSIVYSLIVILDI